MACPPGHIQVRRDTTANWLAKNPVLLPGEFSYVLDGPRNCTECSTSGGPTGPQGATGPIGNPLELNGGGAKNLYIYGPVLNCGTSS